MTDDSNYEIAPTVGSTVRVATANVRARKHRLVQTVGSLAGTEFPLQLDNHLIGRAGDADIRLKSESVSRHHARVIRRQDEYVIEDLGSSHGVHLNELRVHSAILRDGDVLQLADVVLKYEEF